MKIINPNIINISEDTAKAIMEDLSDRRGMPDGLVDGKDWADAREVIAALIRQAIKEGSGE